MKKEVASQQKSEMDGVPFEAKKIKSDFRLIGLSRNKSFTCSNLYKEDIFWPKVDMPQDRFDALFEWAKNTDDFWKTKWIAEIKHDGLYEDGTPLDREHLIAHVVTIAKNILQQYPPKTQSQSSINVDEDLNEAEIEISTMWCEVIHAIAEADKKGIEVGEFIPTFLEANYNISRKAVRVNVDEAAEKKLPEPFPDKNGIYISPSGERLSIFRDNEWKLYLRDDAAQDVIDKAVAQWQSQQPKKSLNI